MNKPSINIGNGKWATKATELLGYKEFEAGKFLPKIADVSRGSEATYVDDNGVIQTADADVARIDYSEDVGGAMLLEPQSTNLVTYSEDFSFWSLANQGTANVPIIVSNNSLSPYGILNATRIQFNTSGILGSDRSKIQLNLGSGILTDCTLSIYVKSYDGLTHSIVLRGITTTSQHNVTDEWTRITFTVNEVNRWFEMGLYGNSKLHDTADILIFGAQLEESSYETSYIPTNGSTVTRLADAVTNCGDVNDFNSEEGVIYLEIQALFKSGLRRKIAISNSVVEDTNVTVYFDSAENSIRAKVVIGGVVEVFIIRAIDTTLMNSVAFKWKENDCKLYLNGVLDGTDTSCLVPSADTLNSLDFDRYGGIEPFFGKLKALKVYKSIADAQVDLPYIT